MSIINDRGPLVRVVASASTWMEGEALRQLDVAACLPGMRRVVGMPDLHPGKHSPIGAALFSPGMIYPSLVGGDIGCGIGLWATSLPVHKARPERLAEQMGGLDQPWDGDIAATLHELGVQPGGDDASLGTPGRGNHFVEVQRVHEVHDPLAWAGCGLDERRLVLLVHTGSRGLGAGVLEDQAAVSGGAGLAEGSAQADAYLARHDHAMRWAAANRIVCARRVFEATRCEGERVLDVCHNSVERVRTLEGTGWLHRKGAAPSDRGLVAIPGSRDDLTWLVRPEPGREDVLWSLAHGAGRRLARGESRGKLRGRYTRDELRRNRWGGLVVCGEEMLAWEEAGENYKRIEGVVDDLVQAGLVSVVATLQPLVTFKTSEGVRTLRREARQGWQQDRREARDAKGRRSSW